MLLVPMMNCKFISHCFINFISIFTGSRDMKIVILDKTSTPP